MAGVTLDGVSKSFGGLTVVDEVSLEIPDGTFAVLLGPSGCGKTTTLRMIAGLEECTSGEMRIGDVVVNDVPPAERDIAMVFQSYALYPHMTVAENIGFGLKMRRLPRTEITARISEVAELLDLGGLLQRKPRQLSGGQRQRVALGRAIARRPAVFLMDEPLSNLDARLRAQTRAELIKLHAELGTTIVYVTHDQVEAMTMGERVVVMDGGRVQQVAAPHDVYLNPANTFVAGFIGSPPMNLIPARLSANGSGPVADLGGVRVGLGHLATGDSAPREITFGIRPEHARIDTAASTFTVEMLELLGHDSLVHLSGPVSIQVRVDARQAPRPGDRVGVTIDAESACIFDPHSGARLL